MWVWKPANTISYFAVIQSCLNLGLRPTPAQNKIAKICVGCLD
mgnify:CR=1 FL=1